MRFDKRVTLILKSKEKPYYDPELGKMVGGGTTKKVVPANVGPISLAALKTDEFNAIAFGRSFLSSTISITKLCLCIKSIYYIRTFTDDDGEVGVNECESCVI